MTESLSPVTLAVGHGYAPASALGAAKPPIYMTSTFVAPSAAALKAQHQAFFDGREAEAGYIYARLGNPNVTMIEQRWAVLDQAEEAAVFASGMAAIATTMLAFLQPGDSVLHSQPLYSGTDNLMHKELSRLGVTAQGFSNGLDRSAIETAAEAALARGPVGLIWLESPANPTNGLVDLQAVAAVASDIARRQWRRPVVAVDNTFLGPLVQNPLRHGIDLCMTSLTKYAAGHSDLLAGGISGSAPLLRRVKQMRTLLGTTLDAHTAWLLLRSIETMPLRTERAAENAAKVAAFLRSHPKIRHVNYLGFIEPNSMAGAVFARQCVGAGSTFSFKIRGGEIEAFAMLDSLRLLKLAVSLGGTETLICHSASTTHFSVPPVRREALGIDSSSIRISVGIEAAADIINDLDQALEAIP